MMTTLRMTPAAARKAAAADQAETRRARRAEAESETAAQPGRAGLKARVSRLQRLIKSEPAHTTARRRLTKWLREAEAALKAAPGR